MRRLNLPLILIVAAATLHCVKKQFVAFEKPHAVMQIRSKAKLEILQEPLKKEMIVWDSEKLAEIPVEGLLRVTYKQTDYFYLQMNCPAELKCNGKKVYIPRNLTHAADAGNMPFKSEYKEPPADAKTALFLLGEAAEVKQLIVTRDWFAAAVKKDIPPRFDEVIFEASLPEANQVVYAGNLYFLARSFGDQQFMEKPPAEFLQSFPVYSELKKNKTTPISEESRAFLRALRNATEKHYKVLLRKEIEDFPFTNPSYGAMASAFNKINEPQLLKAELAAKITKGGSFIVKQPASIEAVAPGGGAIYAQEPATGTTPAPAPTPVTVEATGSLTSGVVFEYKMGGKKIQIPVAETELTAFAHDKGLGFQLGKEKDKAVILEPTEESLFLKSGNKAEIQKFIKAIPDYKEIVKEYDLDLALLRIAMKYGVGELNRRTGIFEYEIDLAKNRNFWIVLAAVKKEFGVDDEDTFSAEIPPRFMPYNSEDRSKGQIKWYQKYEKDTKLASMGIKGDATYCQRTCYEVSIDVVCLNNKQKLKVNFRPSALNEQNGDKNASHSRSPNLHADFLQGKESRGTTSCSDYLKIAGTEEKFE